MGRYNVEGQDPAGSTDAGTAMIEKTGDTYRAVWTRVGTRFVGTASSASAATRALPSATGPAAIRKLPCRAMSHGCGLVWTDLGTDLGTDVAADLATDLDIDLDIDLGTERWTR